MREHLSDDTITNNEVSAVQKSPKKQTNIIQDSLRDQGLLNELEKYCKEVKNRIILNCQILPIYRNF